MRILTSSSVPTIAYYVAWRMKTVIVLTSDVEQKTEACRYAGAIMWLLLTFLMMRILSIAITAKQERWIENSSSITWRLSSISCWPSARYIYRKAVRMTDKLTDMIKAHSIESLRYKGSQSSCRCFYDWSHYIKILFTGAFSLEGCSEECYDVCC